MSDNGGASDRAGVAGVSVRRALHVTQGCGRQHITEQRVCASDKGHAQLLNSCLSGGVRGRGRT
jgi:hypothetical protein